jgi:hypothetical protein
MITKPAPPAFPALHLDRNKFMEAAVCRPEPRFMGPHPLAVHVYDTPGQVEAQLAGVQPLIDAARTAVGGIKADHINEVRHMLGGLSWVLAS